jgi:hypothetical protein
MTSSLNAFVAWPVGHRDIFEEFLKEMLSDTQKFSSAKAAVGKYVLELLQQQAARLEAAKNESGPAFDTRGESIEIIMSLYDNLKHLEKRTEAYKVVLAAPDSQLEEFRDKKKHPWLTASGWARLDKAWDLGNTARSYLTKLPLRAGAQRAVTLLTIEVLRETPSVDSLRFALASTWRGFWNYYTDYRKVIDTHGPQFLEAMKPLQDALQLIEAGMAENEARAEAQRIAEEAAARRAAEEAEEEEQRARWAAEEEEEEQQRQRSYVEPDTYQSSYYDDDSNDYHSNYNPATGMPTCGAYGPDSLGNTYGTTDHMF